MLKNRTYRCFINAVEEILGAVIPDEKSIFDLSEKDFDDVVDLNLKGTVLPSIVFGEVLSMKVVEV